MWPKDVWALLLQCSLSGKEQEVCSTLPIDQSLDYGVVKSAVLRAFELVPEAYRQKFVDKQTFVEFARDKKTLFEKWCLSSKITTLDQLQELFLLEDFKSCIPENVVVHLNEQKVAVLSNAAVLADEFVLTHWNVCPPPRVFSRTGKGEAQSNVCRKNALSDKRDKAIVFIVLIPVI